MSGEGCIVSGQLPFPPTHLYSQPCHATHTTPPTWRQAQARHQEIHTHMLCGPSIHPSIVSSQPHLKRPQRPTTDELNHPSSPHHARHPRTCTHASRQSSAKPASLPSGSLTGPLLARWRAGGRSCAHWWCRWCARWCGRMHGRWCGRTGLVRTSWGHMAAAFHSWPPK